MPGRGLTIHIRGNRGPARFKALIRLRRQADTPYAEAMMQNFVERMELVLDDDILAIVEKITVNTEE